MKNSCQSHEMRLPQQPISLLRGIARANIKTKQVSVPRFILSYAVPAENLESTTQAADYERHIS